MLIEEATPSLNLFPNLPSAVRHKFGWRIDVPVFRRVIPAAHMPHSGHARPREGQGLRISITPVQVHISSHREQPHCMMTNGLPVAPGDLEAEDLRTPCKLHEIARPASSLETLQQVWHRSARIEDLAGVTKTAQLVEYRTQLGTSGSGRHRDNKNRTVYRLQRVVVENFNRRVRHTLLLDPRRIPSKSLTESLG